MGKGRVVRGKMADSRHIELEEPIDDVKGEVEVVVRPLSGGPAEGGPDVFDFILALPPGKRTKEEIDAQLRKERDAWGDLMETIQ